MLRGQVAVVTGAARGIGFAIAKRFCKEGASVLLVDIDPVLGTSATQQLCDEGYPAVFAECDVSDALAVEKCMQTVWEKYGRLDVLVNNAAVFEFGHLCGEGSGSGTGLDKDVTEEQWIRTFRTNVMGYANCIKAAVFYMKKNDIGDLHYVVDEGRGPSHIDAGSRGAIVNIASISSFIAQPEYVPYNASKGAVLQLTRCCAMDLAKFKIRVNAVAPGTVETSAAYNVTDLHGQTLEAGKEAFASACPMQRLAAPDEIANGVVFLASNEASFMTGATIMMDGGLTI